MNSIGPIDLTAYPSEASEDEMEIDLESESSDEQCASDEEIRELTEVSGRPRKRLPVDRRKMRGIKLFDPPKSRKGARKGSEPMLRRAKEVVLATLEKHEALGQKMKKPSPLEQAYLDAAGRAAAENNGGETPDQVVLTFDYNWMKELVQKAQFGKPNPRMGFDVDDAAYNDNTIIVINSTIPRVQKEISIILMHECLHNTVERACCRGNPNLSEETEHMAMALLGDRDEQQDYFQKYFNFDYVNENWLKISQRWKRRHNPNYLTSMYTYEGDSDFDSDSDL